MNWYKWANLLIKQASVTMMPADSLKVYRPMTLGDLHWKFTHDFILPELSRMERSKEVHIDQLRVLYHIIEGSPMHSFESINPNSGKGEPGYNSYTGNIYFETYRPLNPDKIGKILGEWVEHMSLIDDFLIKWERSDGGDSPNKPGYLMEHGIDPSTITHWKVMVIKNPSEYVDEIPELNMANSNWFVLAEMLFPEGSQYEDSMYSGSVSVDDLENRLSRAEGLLSSRESGWIESPSDSHNLEIPEDADPQERARIIREQHENRKHIRVHDFGIHSNQIERYFDEIKKIISYCRKHGVSEIVWS